MILTYGDTSLLKNKDWNVIELRSEKTSEETIKRIGKALSNVFKEDPAEVFVPIAKRELDTFELLTDCYIFIRSLDPKKIVRIRSVTGVVWVVCHGEGTHPNRVINIDKEYIEGLISKCEGIYNSRSRGVVEGSFVRIVDGHTRDFCGIVKNINNDSAIIEIDLKTTSLLIETPIKNLINIDSIPEELRVFYYSTHLADNSIVSDELINLLKEDRVGSRVIETAVKTIEDSDYYDTIKLLELSNDGLKKNKVGKTKRTNQQMITAFVKNLIQNGEKNVRVIASKLFEAIKADKIKRPKNLIIAWCVIKYHITKTMYGDDPDIKSYKDVITKYGSSYRISIKELSKMAPWIPIQSEEVCNDGRSKRARQKKAQKI